MTSGSANCHSALALKEHPGPQTVRAGRGVRRYSFRFPTARVPERQRSACPSRSPGRPAGRQEVASAADTPPSPIADKPTMPSISLIVSISSHRRSYGVQMRTGGSCRSGPDVVRRTRVPRAREPVVSRTRCAYTIDVAENYFLKQVVMPLHARAAVQDRDRCTPPTPDATGPVTSVAAPTEQPSYNTRAFTGYRAHWVNLLPSVLPSNLRAAGYTRHDHAPWSHHPPTLYAPHGSGKHHGSHHSSLPICGPLPCSHLLQRSHQECDGVIGLLLSERVDRRIQLRGEAVLGEVLEHPRGAPCWSRGRGSW